MRFCLLAVTIILCFSCSSKNPPEYIKDVYVAKAGVEGVKIYVILADKQDKETTCSGRISIKLDGYTSTEQLITIYDSSYSVSEKDFQEYKAKPSSSASLILPSKYLSYNDFKNQSKIASAKAFISLKFTPESGGKTLTANKPISLPE